MDKLIEDDFVWIDEASTMSDEVWERWMREQELRLLNETRARSSILLSDK